MNFPVEWLAPIMFAVLFVFMLSGFPVAFALAANGLLFGFIAIEMGLMNVALLQALPDRLFGIMSNDTLLAIPFFTFMGLILQRSGMAEDLLETIGQLFGRVRGGLAYAVILVGALLAATTGVVAASVISMGLISLPVMQKYGYSAPVSTGVIAASGTLAQILPPSLVLIVMADQLGVSVGDMYLGALLPSLLLVGLFIAYIAARSWLTPHAMPALPAHADAFIEGNGSSGIRSFLVLGTCSVVAGFALYHGLLQYSGSSSDTGIVAAIAGGTTCALVIVGLNAWLRLELISQLAKAVVLVLLPPLALIFLVLGSIFVGLATPTEGGAMGAVGALILSMAKGRLSIETLKQALDSTTKLSCFVMFILIGSTVFGLTFRAIEGDVWVESLLGDLPGGEYGFLIAVQILVFVLGFFLDFFEIAFILIPLLLPVAQNLDINLVWFGVMIAMNLQTSFLTPPFGFSLFYLKSVTPKAISSLQIYKGALPFIVIQIVMVVMIFLFPGLVGKYDEKQFEDSPLKIEIPTQNYGYGSRDGQPFVPNFSQ